MAPNSRLTLQASATLNAAATLTGSWTDISEFIAGTVLAKVTNGVIGPTVAAYVDIEAASDNTGTGAVRVCRLTSQLGGSVVTPLTFRMPDGLQWIRSVCTGNTVQAVTVEVYHDGAPK